MANYPTSLPDIATVTRASDASDGSPTEPVAIVNEIAGEVEAIGAELGLSPSGSAATVVARLDALDTTVAAKAVASDVTTALAAKADTSAVAELARDAVGTALTAGTGITVTPNDGADTITVATSAILPTIADAKGDLIAGTAADTVARLAVGANGHVLTADSAEATGLKWAAASGGSAGASAFFTAYSGSFASATAGAAVPLSNPSLTVPPTGDLAAATGVVYFVRFTASTASTPNYVALFMGSVGSGGAETIEAAIYTTSGTRVTTPPGSPATFAELVPNGLTYITVGTGGALTVGTDYYYAVRFVYTTGTTNVKCLTAATTDFAAAFYDGSLYLAFTKTATLDASLTLTSGVAGLTAVPWMAGAMA